MRRITFALAIWAALALPACYTMHLDCPCSGAPLVATTGGQTALVDALLPLLTKAAAGGAFLTAPTPTKPEICGTVDTSGVDILGTATIACSTK